MTIWDIIMDCDEAMERQLAEEAEEENARWAAADDECDRRREDDII